VWTPQISAAEMIPVNSTQQKMPLSRLLRMAVLTGVASAVTIHIKRGDDLNARDSDGLTLLMLAAQKNRAEICKLLLDASADPCLRNINNKNALEIAKENASHEIVALLEMAMEKLSRSHPLSDQTLRLESIQGDVHEDKVGLLFIEDSGPTMDIDGWEEEPQLVAPISDPVAKSKAADVQNEISTHIAIDFSVDWDDVETFLPEFSTPLSKVHDPFAREKLRMFLLRAIREGSVPYEGLNELALNDDRSANDEAETLLAQVINDLGAEVDDRHEYSTDYESFEVFVEPQESAEEELELDDALFSIDQHGLRRNEPLRLFQRDFQHIALLTSEQEVSLAQEMERQIETALNAVARSASGIEKIFIDAGLVRSGEKHLRWISDGKKDEENQNPSDSLNLNISESEDDDEINHESLRATPVDSELTVFFSSVDQLWAEVRTLASDVSSIERRRNLIGAMRLSRPYLLFLEDSHCINEDKVAQDFSRSMRRYKKARDQMVEANIKLAYSIAKKYSYYSETLDDLLQEANLGLMKAADRFSWRRGFKFSTYATWWIRQSVYRYVSDKSRLIRLPVHIFEKAQKVERLAQDFERDHMRLPTLEEVAQLSGFTMDKVTAYRKQMQEPLSMHLIDIDNMIAVDEKDDFIAPDPVDILIYRDAGGLVDKLLKTLSPEDESLLRLRYGIGMVNEMTLEEIGDLRGVTRERVRQIESSLIRKLKNPQVLDPILFGSKRLEKVIVTQEKVVNRFRTQSMMRGKLIDVDKVGKATVEKPASHSPFLTAAISNFSAVTTPTDNSIPEQVRKLLEQAVEFGAQIKSESSSGDDSVWIDFTKGHTSPPRAFYRKLIACGFTYWGGKWSWR
jgi:RNA polymerase primary sigma factor